MTDITEIKIKISDDDKSVGYIYMPLDKNVNKIIHHTIDISDVITNYNGVPVYLDFNENNQLIGIEIVGND